MRYETTPFEHLLTLIIYPTALGIYLGYRLIACGQRALSKVSTAQPLRDERRKRRNPSNG